MGRVTGDAGRFGARISYCGVMPAPCRKVIDIVDGRPSWRLAREHVDLMAKNQNLGITPVSVPKIRSDRTCDVARQGSGQIRAGRQSEPHDGPAHPY
jgi:hypothetical protein